MSQDVSPQRHIWIALLAIVLILPLLLLEWRSRPPTLALTDRPEIAPESGHYGHPIAVSLRQGREKGTLYYTLDGRHPSDSGIQYEKPLALAGSDVFVVRTATQHTDGTWGEVANATYIVGLETHLPVLSVIGDPDGFWADGEGIFAVPEGRGDDWERVVDLMFFEGSRHPAHKKLAFVSPAGMRIHGSASRAYPKPSLRLYFRTDYGNPRLNYPIYQGQPNMELETFDRMILHSGSQDSSTPPPDIRTNWTILRTALLYDLAAELNIPTSQSRPLLLFVNGESYGIYQIRTFINEEYLEDRYGDEVDDFFTISGDPGSPGALFDPDITTVPGKANWLSVLAFVEQNDLNDPAVYAELQEMIELEQLIDYTIIMMYVGNIDWLRNNVKLYRNTETDKWNWAIWDVDFGFGLAPWTTVETDMVEWLYTSEQAGFEEGSLLLRTLLENEVFRQRFLNRMDALLATTLAPEKVTRQLDVMAEEMRPDIHFETDLWSSSGDWEANVAEMREFIERRPEIMREDWGEWGVVSRR